MDYQTITTREDGGIGIVTLARPDMMNALNRQMRAELTHALTDIASRARVLVLTGSGRAFCSGQDLGDGGSAANIDLERTLREEYEPMLRAIYDAPVPVICAVNGAAAGAGANLALAADVVIAHEDAVFIQAFSKIGLIPDAGGTWFLPRQVGFARAMGAMLFADRISAQQAVDWGMIWEAAPADSFDTLWMARAHVGRWPNGGISQHSSRAAGQPVEPAEHPVETGSPFASRSRQDARFQRGRSGISGKAPCQLRRALGKTGAAGNSRAAAGKWP